jgi:fucose 4-O-acetylase-like acetyltransferase
VLWIRDIFCSDESMRIKTLDVMKGMAILAVVWGHVVFESLGVQGAINNLSYNIVSSFHMPLFFIVAGFLLYKAVNKEYYQWIRDKATYLLIPHYTVGILVYLIPLWIPALKLAVPNFTFLQWIVQVIFLNQGEWFLWTLFCVFVVLGYVSKFHGDKFWMALFGIVAIALIFPTRLLPNFFGIKDLQWYLPFSVIGIIIAKYYQKSKWWLILVLGIAYIPIMLVTQWQGGWVHQPLDSLLKVIGITRFLQAISGVCLIACLAYLFRNTKILQWLGKYSFSIYITNFLFIGLGIGVGMFHAVTGFIISIAISVCFCLILRNIKWMNRWFPKVVLND